MHKPIHIYAGPSLFGTKYQCVGAGNGPNSNDEGLRWLPPAKRGDVDRLVREEPAGVIALADGTFHSYPAVAHHELRDAVRAGWVVYGLCSMGAIRACELRHMGMRPWGHVAQMFCDDRDMPDDEVALVHGTEAPYFPLSEPLVHIREFVEQMRRAGHLDDVLHKAVMSTMRERWYGERTLVNLREELASLVDAKTMDRLDDELTRFDRYRLKQKDLVAFIETAPWQSMDQAQLVG